jgi:hypothetical protein
MALTGTAYACHNAIQSSPCALPRNGLAQINVVLAILWTSPRSFTRQPQPRNQRDVGSTDRRLIECRTAKLREKLVLS